MGYHRLLVTQAKMTSSVKKIARNWVFAYDPSCIYREVYTTALKYGLLAMRYKSQIYSLDLCFCSSQQVTFLFPHF
jgi:hypothetical protein